MKRIILLIVSTFALSSSAQAVNDQLQMNISNAVDSLLWDTVNEGEVTALVTKVNDQPQMQCSLTSHRKPGQGLAKCEVQFSIETQFDGEVSTCSQSCFLIHSYDLKTLKVTGRVEGLTQTCIENLSAGCE